jgi:Phospholipase/Carboxylesterase
MNVRDAPAIGQSVEYVRGLVRDEIAAGTPADRIVIGGFSQVPCVPPPSCSSSSQKVSPLCQQEANTVFGVVLL